MTYYEVGDVIVETTPRDAAEKYLSLIPRDEWPEELEVKEWRTDTVNRDSYTKLFDDQVQKIWDSLYDEYGSPFEHEWWNDEKARIKGDDVHDLHQQFIDGLIEKFKPYTCSHMATHHFSQATDGMLYYGNVTVKLLCGGRLINRVNPSWAWGDQRKCEHTYNVDIHYTQWERGEWKRFCQHCGSELGPANMIDLRGRNPRNKGIGWK